MWPPCALDRAPRAVGQSIAFLFAFIQCFVTETSTKTARSAGKTQNLCAFCMIITRAVSALPAWKATHIWSFRNMLVFIVIFTFFLYDWGMNMQVTGQLCRPGSFLPLFFVRDVVNQNPLGYLYK